MRNLPCANFQRVWKSKIFWTCMALMLFYGLRLAYDRFFAEWLPGGQGRYYAIHAGSDGMAPMLAAYSLAVIIASTAIGLFLFRRKDLK